MKRGIGSRTARIAAAILLVLTALGGRPAQADIFYTVTVTGTVTSGMDNGLFGGLGDLVGQHFVMEQRFDGTTATVGQDSAYAYHVLLPVGGSAIVTINGHSYEIYTPVSSDSGYFLAAGIATHGPGSGYADQISGTVSGAEINGSPAIARLSVVSTLNSFLQSATLDQWMYFQLIGNQTGEAHFATEQDGSAFDGSIQTVLVAVPEPASLALFVFGAGACLRLRRRSAAR